MKRRSDGDVAAAPAAARRPQHVYDHGAVMTIFRHLLVLAFGAGLGVGGAYWYAAGFPTPRRSLTEPAASTARPVLYYRDPGGAPFWSVIPKKDPQGRDYVPVYDDSAPSSASPSRPPAAGGAAKGERRILYYRNPMGLPDTSPLPKKDTMGMNYIPVYEGEEPADSHIVKVSLDRVQRIGVRSERVQMRTLVQPVHAVGTAKYDERRQTVVTLRSDGYVEDLFVNATGQSVKAGEPLFRVYSRDIQMAQIELLQASENQGRTPGEAAARSVAGTAQRLRNFGVPESRIEDVQIRHLNPRTLDWPAPITGTVIDKRIINGQNVRAGDELYRIIDLSQVWVIADVAEADLAAVKPGTRATVTFRAYPGEPVEGMAAFIYPDVRAETRTVRVRIELPNPGERLKAEMYADVVFQAGADPAPVVAVPNGAIIDSGSQQIVLVARGEGRFEPRRVKLGRRGRDYREVIDGLRAGEEVVTTATFLIDAESNLQTALKAFTQETSTMPKEASR
jgi:Cu(I)/Ag(I) efflux system membrane fusion protein